MKLEFLKKHSIRLNDKLLSDGGMNLLRNVLNANYAPVSSELLFY